MRILVVSDVVDNRIYSEKLKENFSDIDLILSAGDLPCSYLEYIVSILNKPLLFVNGNHDNKGEYSADGHMKKECQGGINSHGKVIRVKGLIIAGFEGSFRYNRGSCQYTEPEMHWNYLKMIPSLFWHRFRFGRACDILLTHAPPLGMGDSPSAAHRGFQTFLRFMRRFRPVLHVHGHIHLYDRNEPFQRNYLETTVLNAYGFKVLDVDVEKRTVKLVQF